MFDNFSGELICRIVQSYQRSRNCWCNHRLVEACPRFVHFCVFCCVNDSKGTNVLESVQQIVRVCCIVALLSSKLLAGNLMLTQRILFKLAKTIYCTTSKTSGKDLLKTCVIQCWLFLCFTQMKKYSEFYFSNEAEPLCLLPAQLPSGVWIPPRGINNIPLHDENHKCSNR